MTRPRLLDLFCCQGGASRGYADAGFEVVGLDLDPQPRYPYGFRRGDALEVMNGLLDGAVMEFREREGSLRRLSLDDFDAIHASPPCQAKTKAQKIQGRVHPRLIAPTRTLLKETGLPYIIENVVPDGDGVDPDPLIDPVMLCGAMFGIETYRHRLFETNWALDVPDHPIHLARTTKMGRRPIDGEFMHVVGNFSGVDKGRRVMGMPWASRDGLREAIPPAYSEFIGRQLIDAVSHVLT